MPDTNAYAQHKERLEEIVLQTRSKDVPLEKSLDLYDEALAIGARCVELIEQTDFTAEELELASEHLAVSLSGAVLSGQEATDSRASNDGASDDAETDGAGTGASNDAETDGAGTGASDRDASDRDTPNSDASDNDTSEEAEPA